MSADVLLIRMSVTYETLGRESQSAAACSLAASVANRSARLFPALVACPLTHSSSISPSRSSTTSATSGRHRSWFATGSPLEFRQPFALHPAHHRWRKQLTTYVE